jgi:S-(hydroxymethyl)glutathione dehydrogenase/alcohol dehydrogenase
VVSENRVTRVPADAPRELCALLGCSLSTALGTIENEAELKFGERILIVGVGGLGSSLILAAKLRGAGYIAACDVHDKAALAHVMGAHEFCYSADVHKTFDVIVDTAGAGDSMASTLPFLRSGGRFIMLGQQRPKDDVLLRNARHMFDGEGKRIIATQGGQFNPSADIPRYIQLWQSGALKLDQLITHRIGLPEINLGIDLVRKGHAGRVLVEF